MSLIVIIIHVSCQERITKDHNFKTMLLLHRLCLRNVNIRCIFMQTYTSGLYLFTCGVLTIMLVTAIGLPWIMN